MVGFVLLITLLFANGNDIYKSIIEVKKIKVEFYLHKSNDSLSLHFTTETFRNKATQ
jgi:hypothetical protein